MPDATATTLIYSELVDLNIAEGGDVNFADSVDYGHRVLVEMSKSAVNSFLRWERNVGSDRPTAVLGDSTEFTNALLYALSTEFTDIDGVNNGLHYGTSNLSTNTDSRIREGGLVSMNDIALAFVLWKIYGSSTTMTKDHIYNLEDAFGMATNESVATAILQSFQNNLPVVDAMFRDLLAADPMRFFDGSGNQLTGLFETNADVSGSDSWQLVENDILEIKLRFTFENSVTRRGVAGHEHNITYPENTAGDQENQQTIIGAGDYFYIRLQLKVADVVVPPTTPPKTTKGTLSWFIRIFTTAGQNQYLDSVTDSNGNIYVCGYTATTTTARDVVFETFGTKVGTTITNSNTYKQSLSTNPAVQVGILVKYSKEGVPLWHTYVTGVGGFTFNSMGTDNQNNIYVYGQSLTNFNIPKSSVKSYYHRNATTGALELYGTASTSSDGYVRIKYNSSGSIQWISNETLNTNIITNNKCFNVDKNGNSYSMYHMNGNATIGLWNPAIATSIGGTIKLTGTVSSPEYYGNYGFGGSVSQISIIVKRDSNGNPVWVCPITQSPLNISMAFDSNDNLVISFGFGSSIAGNSMTLYNGATYVNSSFTPTPWGTINGKSSSDTCIVKYSPSGSVLWVNHFYHNSTSVASADIAHTLCIDSNNNIYCSGTYQGDLSICNASSTGGVQPIPYGILPQSSNMTIASIYIVKLNSNGQIIPNCITNINSQSFGAMIPYQGVVDSNGNFYLGVQYPNSTGISINNFTSDPGTTSSSISTTNAKTIAKVGSTDFVLIKYSPTFQVLFSNPINGVGATINNFSLTIDTDGKVSALINSTNSANQLIVYDGTGLTSNISAYIPSHPTFSQAILLHYD
jgi:hypothetical protein